MKKLFVAIALALLAVPVYATEIDWNVGCGYCGPSA